VRARRQWPADSDGCKSCRTTQRSHKCHGYCTRCYPIAYRVSRIDRGLYRRRRRSPRGSISTTGIRKNAEAELHAIRELEAPIRNGAIGTDVENLLVSIAEQSRAKPDHLYGVRHFFDGCLDREQRTRVYQIVARFADNLPVGALSTLILSKSSNERVKIPSSMRACELTRRSLSERLGHNFSAELVKPFAVVEILSRLDLSTRPWPTSGQFPSVYLIELHRPPLAQQRFRISRKCKIPPTSQGQTRLQQLMQREVQFSSS
jgi:hypothetical protein